MPEVAAAAAPAPENKQTQQEKDWKAEADRKEQILQATQAKNKQFEDELNKYRQAEQEAKTKELQTKEEQERNKLTEQGKYQEALKNVETSLTSKYQSEITNLYSAVNNEFVPAVIKAAAGRIPNIVKEALEDLPRALSGKVRLDPKTMKPFVVGDDGKPMIDEKLVPVSVDAFVESFVKARPYLLADGMPKGTGLVAGSGAGGGKAFTVQAALGNPKMAAEWKKADPTGYTNAFQEYHASLLKPKAK